MRRLLPVCLLLSVVFVAGCGRLRNQPVLTPAPLDMKSPQAATATPAPAAQTPAHVQAADAFLAAWSEGDTKTAYGCLSDRLRSFMTEADFATQLTEVKVKTYQVQAQAASANVAYVIYSVNLAKPVAGSPIAGYSLLLKKVQDRWVVALFLAEEKLASAYKDLLIIPAAKGKGYIVTYTDKDGARARSDLQEP
jgi:hypothetical protein